MPSLYFCLLIHKNVSFASTFHLFAWEECPNKFFRCFVVLLSHLLQYYGRLIPFNSPLSLSQFTILCTFNLLNMFSLFVVISFKSTVDGMEWNSARFSQGSGGPLSPNKYYHQFNEPRNYLGKWQDTSRRFRLPWNLAPKITKLLRKIIDQRS